ncbi:uncharacterized protein LOC125960867 [Orcinus orca]|uniref:uncharacterized protein LOC125960867 n=1 Tax=Orcinus orca TaxID=9733 RepID=UPI002111FE6D|nr:uncharacterized protein LOC125960867 [Orcinus orca]
MDLKDHSQRAAAGGTTEGRRGLGGGCWAVVRAARGVGSAEAWVGRCVRDSRRSWTGCERAADVGRRPGAPRRSGSAQGARSGASGARPPSWSRWRRPGGPRRDELELGPERDESATPRTWTPGWSPVSRGAAGGENVPACMPTGTTFSRTVKPSVNYAVPPSSRILVPGPHNEELGAPVANPAERKGGTEMREKITGTLGAIWCCCRPKSRNGTNIHKFHYEPVSTLTDFSKITGFIERHVNRSWVPRNLCRFLQLLSSLSFCNQHVCLNPSAVKHRQELRRRDFPGGTVVKNPPANAGYTGLSPGPERSHMPWSN